MRTIQRDDSRRSMIMIMGEWGRRKRKRSHRWMSTKTKINTTCERKTSGPEVTAMRRTKN
jgi:hypothetical protein